MSGKENYPNCSVEGSHKEGSYGQVNSFGIAQVARTGSGTKVFQLGGCANGLGFTIAWQHGPRGKYEDGMLRAATGATVEDVLIACSERLQWLQDGPYPSEQGAEALDYIERAIGCLIKRRDDRSERNVEGTNQK